MNRITFLLSDILPTARKKKNQHLYWKLIICILLIIQCICLLLSLLFCFLFVLNPPLAVRGGGIVCRRWGGFRVRTWGRDQSVNGKRIGCFRWGAEEPLVSGAVSRDLRATTSIRARPSRKWSRRRSVQSRTLSLRGPARPSECVQRVHVHRDDYSDNGNVSSRMEMRTRGSSESCGFCFLSALSFPASQPPKLV